MYFKKLEVKGFGKLKEKTANLSEGMNIVYGNNESGKTSLQWFIKAVLFGLKGGRSSREGVLPPAKKFKPWAGGDYSGSIEYCIQDGTTFRAERNFENNVVKVYDSMYNDVTNDFEISRDRGALFAEKQLGMNEVCFEKTAFIKQMESRLDEDGTKELLNRLINVTQTGFEDVSFKNAQEALKEALKTYVGNDKTSTRPLDKVISRLHELTELKSQMILNRDSAMNAEREMGDAILFRDNLLIRKEALSKVVELIETTEVTKKNIKLKKEIEDLLRKINVGEEETIVLNQRSSDFQRTREELNLFSDYSENDSESITLEFNQLKLCEGELKRLQEEIAAKKSNLQRLEMEFEPFKAYGKLSQSFLNETVEAYKEYDSLRKEHEKGNVEGLTEKIKSLQKKNTLLKGNLFISCILSLLLLTFGMLNIGTAFGPVCLAGAVIGLASAVISGISIRSTGKELTNILNEKRMSFVNANHLYEEMNRKQKAIEGTFEMVGAKDIEDFLASKSQYESKKQYIEILRTEFSSLEIRNATSLAEYNSLKDKIRNRLIKVNLIHDETTEISENHISTFKNNIRKYLGLLPGINYTLKRLEDLAADLDCNYQSVSERSGLQCSKKEDIESFLEKLSSQIEFDERSIKDVFSDICKKYRDNGLSASELAAIGKKLEAHEAEDLSIDFGYELNKASEDLSGTLIQIKEYEVMLKEFSSQGSELQKIEEEIEELKMKKNVLEDINISLKLALQVLTEASLELQKDFAPALNSKMSSMINQISSGRYTDLRADSNLLLKTISPETGEVVNAVSLSGGTIDQMYLAMRISAADLLTGQNENLPLIMDEVFAQYDDERTRDAFELLKGISEVQKRQVIFFTCKSREVEIARSVFGEKASVILF